MHLHACWDDNHDAFSLPASRCFTAVGLLSAGAKTRRPSPSSIAIMPFGGFTKSRKAASAGTSFVTSLVRVTVVSCGAFRVVRPNWTRQRNSRLVAVRRRLQTSATATPGFSAYASFPAFARH